LQLVTEMNLFGTVYWCNAVAPFMKQGFAPGPGDDRRAARSLLRNQWFARLAAGAKWIRTNGTAIMGP